MAATNCKASAAALLERDYRIWAESLVPDLPDAERYVASDAASEVFQGPFAPEFAAACQCFYIYRRLHEMADEYPAAATLLGDYFFSRFSGYLMPLDNVLLINAFSAYLKKDISDAASRKEYLDFVHSLPAVLK